MSHEHDIQYLMRQVEELTGRVSRLENRARITETVEVPLFKYPKLIDMPRIYTAQADPGDETEVIP